MIKNFAELQERVRSSEPLVVSVAQAADQEVLLSVKAAADQGFIKPVLTGDRERIEELCGRIGLKPLEILQVKYFCTYLSAVWQLLFMRKPWE